MAKLIKVSEPRSIDYSKKLLLTSLIVSILSSCTPSAPYEVRSPCVSIESANPSPTMSPCIRRPVNFDIG